MSALISTARTEWPIAAMYGGIFLLFTAYVFRWEIVMTLGSLLP